MSFKVWNEYGYGVDVEALTLKGKEEAFKKFVLKHYKGVDEELLENMSLTPADTAEDFLDAFDDYEEEHRERGLWGFVSDVIAKETNIRVEYCHGNDYGEAIMLIPWYPWSKFTPQEGNLTQSSLNEIFEEYFDELGFEEIIPDYQTVEYFG